jgi:hypothetical protein
LLQTGANPRFFTVLASIESKLFEPLIHSPHKSRKNKKKMQLEEDADTDDSTHELRDINTIITALQFEA